MTNDARQARAAGRELDAEYSVATRYPRMVKLQEARQCYQHCRAGDTRR
jgi:hypothetical protein